MVLVKIYVGYYDHGWGGNSLPAVAFSNEEDAKSWCNLGGKYDRDYEEIEIIYPTNDVQAQMDNSSP